MKILDLGMNVNLLGPNDPTTIELYVTLEDKMDVLDNIPIEITLKDFTRINTGDYDKVFREVERLQEEHPFFKLLKCESPIELRFYVYAMHEIPGIRPQITEGPYRIDLAIPEKRVAIELDGHDFHKTKEQRTYDAKRERYLQKQGWQVIRFTGTEINSNVLGCINEAIEIIKITPGRE